ncbi:MAG: tRNA (adenosine(37)-N6)-dimethylallyltransferase MiaA [Acidimicrobiia bacterium]
MTRLVAILGPTAAGKSEMAFRLAEERGAPILSVDSMQVYRGMDIGTAKPLWSERERVRHYMIDVVEPEHPYTVAEFQREARTLIMSDRHPVLVIVGGSGLHFRSVVDPLSFPPHDRGVRSDMEAVADPVDALLEVDPRAGEFVDLFNPRRVVRALEVWHLTGLTPSARSTAEEAMAVQGYEPLYEFTAVGLDPGQALEARIVARSEDMRKSGLLDEVARLRGRLGPSAAAAVGYRQLIPVLDGNLDEEDAWSQVRAETLALAKRQRTFFRRDPRIQWVPWQDGIDDRLAAVREALEL